MPISPPGNDTAKGIPRPKVRDTSRSTSNSNAQTSRVMAVALAVIGVLSRLWGMVKRSITRIFRANRSPPQRAPHDVVTSEAVERARHEALPKHAQGVRARFAQSFPLNHETLEEFGPSASALEELNTDLHRAEISVEGNRIHSIPGFRQALRSTPFAINAETIARLLCQGGIARTYELLNKHATDQLAAALPMADSKISLAIHPLFQSPLRIDFSPVGAKDSPPSHWQVKGSKSLRLLAVSNDWANGIELAPRLTLEFKVEIPVDKSWELTWTNLRFVHFIHLN